MISQGKGDKNAAQAPTPPRPQTLLKTLLRRDSVYALLPLRRVLSLRVGSREWVCREVREAKGSLKKWARYVHVLIGKKKLSRVKIQGPTFGGVCESARCLSSSLRDTFPFSSALISYRRA